MDQSQAIQLAAVAMAPLDGDARRGKAVELRDFHWVTLQQSFVNLKNELKNDYTPKVA